VWAKVEEEIRELKEEIFKNDLQAGIEEFGDVLFALVNAGRFEGYVAEEALQTTTNKFTRRFQYIEKRAREEGKNLKDMTLAEMDEWWNEAKALKI
jgi:uncharacterized protein YabN with tetrapyrrole methylase and pyrophosphatase domain